ncbi:MAG TPA: DUF2585 family protein [Phycisphaerales bacterium]|nr:DUF2585 family protein [Phycisphaerales bacterium]HMP38362.1 DUF2585 family protein [Phycisphaerales bacterium]
MVSDISTTAPTDCRTRPWCWLAIAGVMALTAILLRLEGRVWWCECGLVRVWISNVWTSHCSQHLFDPYSLTHFSHGLIFCWLLGWLAPRWSLERQLVVAVVLAAGWEVLENSPMIIDRYRTATMSLDYLGDSVVNALGDIVACIVGFFVARWLGFTKSFGLFIAIELALLWFIRDNLTLCVLMLLWPIDAIRAWQMGAAPTVS